MNKRIFIEKKPHFDQRSKSATKEIQFVRENSETKVFLIYDIFNLSDEDFHKVKETVFVNPVSDIFHTNQPDLSAFDYSFVVEFVPGQFDQRAESAEEAVKLITGNDGVRIRTATQYAFKNIKESDIESIKRLLINSVDSKEKDLSKIELPQNPSPQEVPLIANFIDWNELELQTFYQENAFSFGFDDLQFIQKYFITESRNPTETELKVLDTYWSDHCRHTTFFTELTSFTFEGPYSDALKESYKKYIHLREKLERQNRPISLMDIGTIAAKHLIAEGKLDDMVISDEINACTLLVDVDVDGKIEPWYFLFKNETHNHPTEIEPFGGASTCLGGAIRDPLSGRAFVYQAMRVSGCADPLESIQDTYKGKLPQRKITKEAADGFSSYGNQIGLSTSHVAEIYHEGYKAKRMEVGFVAGAAPQSWIKRENPEPGDLIIVLGGRTGRDGIGGATGSSKLQDSDAIETMSAEVQKGNAVEERKIQRLFRNPLATKLIKKSNDFGAGGASVAIGEIADGVRVDLNKLPLKYTGLNGTELSISESQERMAIVIDANDADSFIFEAEQEGVEAIVVGEVTDNNRLTLLWNDKPVVDLDRKFLESSGCSKTATVTPQLSYLNKRENKALNSKNFLNELRKLNVASQKGLIEKFDSTVGRTTALLPLGGKNQLTPSLASVHTFPILKGKTNTVSMASFGFVPEISSQNPYLGGAYSVVESIAKLVASGANPDKIRLSFQEYFERLGNDPIKWGKPFASLLGALEAQLAFEAPAIGGKDSMSGTYEELNVPPTLISFAVAIGDLENVIAPAFKRSGHHLYLFNHTAKEQDLPNYDLLSIAYRKIHESIKDGNIVSSQIITEGGLATALAKMSFGNDIGCEVTCDLPLFDEMPGSLIVECINKLDDDLFTYLGETSFDEQIQINSNIFDIDDLKKAWLSTFEDVFPTEYHEVDAYRSEISVTIAHHHDQEDNDHSILDEAEDLIKHAFSGKKDSIQKPKPRVSLPIFPGTNCEYETEECFVNAGAEVDSFVFNNLNQTTLQNSVAQLVNSINNSQILMFSGGFSGGDEPDGAAKYMVSVLKNVLVRDAVQKLLERDGLILGICNGFQALIKSGLVPYGQIQDLNESSPTLTYNQIGRHISQMIDVKVVSNKSPWLKDMMGEVYRIPASHGEGRFYANDEVLNELIANGQIATQYVDALGKVATDMPYNPNGSILGVEGITDKTGRIYGRMGHSERYRSGLIKNIPDTTFMNIFKNGVNYFD